MKRIVVLLLTTFIFMSWFSSISASAASYDIDFKINSETVYLYNTDTGTELYNHNADVKRYPASTTKIMTYIITVENIPDIKNTKVPIKYDLIHSLDGTGSSLSGLEGYIDKQLTVYDLLCCLMVKSGNDAAVVLADFISNGDQAAFAEMMNKKAKEIGCTSTHYVNPHGLHDPEQYTTAIDLCKITEYAMSQPYFTEICSMSSYYLPDDDYPLVATNLLIDPGRGGEYYYKYATGVKTGTTDEAGYCLVASATHNGYSYICVALKSPCYDEDGNWSDDNGAMKDCINFFEWAFDSFEIKTIVDKQTPVCNVQLESAWNKDNLLLVPENNVSMILPYDVDTSEVTISPIVPDSVEAPVSKGDIIGQADLIYQGDVISKVNIVASESVDKSEIVKVTNSVKKALSSLWFIIPVIIVVILFVIYLVVASIYSKTSEQVKKNKR
ncbi:MAG: D-alanyl-D-alanine carboxypeptidase [Clostridia bacterium]|nr:D-alanyl-D-alanine carboxypeptidase [Clostridia bacterium]